MNISTHYNRFYHGVVLKQVLGAPLIKVEDIKIGGVPFAFCPGQMKRQFHGRMDSVKQLLKKLNLDYPRDEDGEPISTIKLDNLQLSQHIEAVIKMCADGGYELPFVADEWERVKEQAEGHRDTTVPE